MAVTNHKTRFGGLPVEGMRFQFKQPLSVTRWPKLQLRSGFKRLLWVELLELTTKCIVVLQWCIGGTCGDNGRPRIHGKWSPWPDLYSSCTRNCNGGVQYRTRLCTNPRYVFKFIRVAKSLPQSSLASFHASVIFLWWLFLRGWMEGLSFRAIFFFTLVNVSVLNTNILG